MTNIGAHLFQRWTAFQQHIVDELIECHLMYRLHGSVCVLRTLAVI